MADQQTELKRLNQEIAELRAEAPRLGGEARRKYEAALHAAEIQAQKMEAELGKGESAEGKQPDTPKGFEHISQSLKQLRQELNTAP